MVITDNIIYFVPDPLKFVTKLGRRDMSNYDHVEEYRVSCCDMMLPLFNTLIIKGLSVGVHERYKGEISECGKLIAVLYTLSMDREKFSKLFVQDSNVKLCMDPSRSRVVGRKLKS